MLSDEKIQVLTDKVAEWGALKKVPANIQAMVVEMGIENPRTSEEKQGVCAAHLWADAVIKWYDDFIGYLESQRKTSTAQAAPDLLLSLKTLRQLLDQIITQVENG